MSRPPRQDRRLTKVLTALRTKAGPGRSPLYRWMYRHHDALAAAFAETPPAWEPLATALAATGLTGIDGTPPTAGRAKQTWYRVRREYFFTSPAWDALRRWVIRHPRLARTLAACDSYLPRWYDRALAEAKALAL